MKHALTIAGSDSGGGAGIQADLKTFAALGVYGMSVITSITAQNTVGVNAVFDIPPDMVSAQCKAVFDDIRVDAVKIGMLSHSGLIHAVAQALRAYRPRLVVLDPVMISKSGHALLQPEAIQTLKVELLPLADLVTPNVPEAEALTGLAITDESSMAEAGRIILSYGAKAVLIKGGHLAGEAVDVLVNGSSVVRIPGKRLEAKHTHGTGCSLSSAIAALSARGLGLEDAVRGAKTFVTRGIAEGFALGSGVGPIHHFAALYSKAGLKPDDSPVTDETITY